MPKERPETLYGKQTALGVANFGPGRRRVADVPALVRAYGQVKAAAARASELAHQPIHPNDHVNAPQSTNDSYPTAMALAIWEVAQPALGALDSLAAAFEGKAAEYADTVRLGRTCLQDAVTLTVGETHRSHVSAIRRVRAELGDAVARLDEVPLGGPGPGPGAPCAPRTHAPTRPPRMRPVRAARRRRRRARVCATGCGAPLG